MAHPFPEGRWLARTLAVLAVGLLPGVAPAFAQSDTRSGAMAEPKPAFSRAQLEALVAPIALYPDRLLANVLIAATYPLDVVEAARWINDPARGEPEGEAFFKALAAQEWDPSVKALTAAPEVLRMMDAQIEWTRRLDDAVVADQAGVMDAVQGLRRQARAAGKLESDARTRVIDEDGRIIIEPASPQVGYIEVYTPPQIYGAWQYPSVPPVSFVPPVYSVPFVAVPLDMPLWDLGTIVWVGHSIRLNEHRWHDLGHHRSNEPVSGPVHSAANGTAVETWHPDLTRRHVRPAPEAIGALGAPATAPSVSPGKLPDNRLENRFENPAAAEALHPIQPSPLLHAPALREPQGQGPSAPHPSGTATAGPAPKPAPAAPAPSAIGTPGVGLPGATPGPR